MSGNSLGIGTGGRTPRKGEPMRAGWGRWVQNSINSLAQQSGGSSQVLMRGKSTSRFQFGGIYKDEDDKWRVRISKGCLFFREIYQYGDFSEAKRKAQFVRGTFPTIKVGDDDVRIDDPSKPELELGSRDAASVWLACKKDRCNDPAPEVGGARLIISDRDEDPDIESDEDAYQIVDFDVEETDGGGKKATEIYQFLESDIVQNYTCNKGNESSDDYDGSDMSDSSDFYQPSGSSTMVSDPSASSEEESDGDGRADCDIRVDAGWENAVACFPKAPGAGTAAIPAPMVVNIRVGFFRQGAFGGKQCEGAAFGVSLAGGTTVNPSVSDTATEYRWRDDWDRELSFYVANPPACGYFIITWRVKTFQAVPDFGEDKPPEDQGCCNLNYSNTAVVFQRQFTGTGPWDRSKTKLGPVCGHSCSSAATTPDSGSGA